MWSTRSEILRNGRVHKISIDLNESPLPFSEALRLWQKDEQFRSFFTALTAQTTFSAFRWETPPLTAALIDRPFEFVLLDSPELESDANPKAFERQFKSEGAGDSVVSFPNLGNDAILVVPCPIAPYSAYSHLAVFLREAPDSQKQALWIRVGKELQKRIGSTPVWLSTAGAGVPWLHVRLDDRPKYYCYEPYKKLV